MLEHNFIFGGFTLSAGVLANKNTGLDNDFRFYPGVDMSYRPNNNWKFYASWNKALRMPTYTDLYISNVVQQGDITLNPEKNSTFKVGTQYRQTGFAATVSGFYAHGTNMIDWVQTSVTEQNDSLVSWLRLFAMPMRFLAMATVSVLCPLTTSPFKADSRMYSANLRLAFLALSLKAS